MQESSKDASQGASVTQVRRSHFERAIRYLEDGSILVDDEVTSHFFINALERIAHRIADGDEDPVERTETARGMRHKTSRLGTDLWNLCKSYDPCMQERYALHMFNPYITVALRAFRKWGMVLLAGRVGDNLDLRIESVRHALCLIVGLIRRACRSKKFKCAVRNYQRNGIAAFKSCTSYLDAQFDRYSKLLIIRVDLYYRPDGKGFGYTEEADAGLDKFLRAMREGRIIPDVVGWICKRENGFRRGMHYHLLVMQDGHKRRDGSHFARTLGEYWVENCTGHAKVGSYFNCFVRQDDYQHNGLGLVHVADPAKRGGLREALRYLTKSNHQLKTGDGKDRNLRKGVRPAKVHECRRGAPRKRADDEMMPAFQPF